MTILGYARVSTDGQTLEAQEEALRTSGATRIFSEKISGTVIDRKALGRALAALQSGSARPARSVNQGPSKHVGGHKRQGRRVSIAQ